MPAEFPDSTYSSQQRLLIFIFLVEHDYYVNYFPFEILISTSILIWLWSKVENDKSQHKGTS